MGLCVQLLVWCCVVHLATGIIVATNKGVMVLGDISMTGKVKSASGLSCCLSNVPISVGGDGSAQPVISIKFENDSWWNGTSAATALGPVPMYQMGSPLPSVTNASRDGKGCMNFGTATSGYLVSRGLLPLLPTGDSSFTMAFWIKTSSPGGINHGTFFAYGYGAARSFNVFRFNGCTQVIHFFYNNDFTWTVPTLCTNTWQHLAVVWDSVSFIRTLYINGVNQSSQFNSANGQNYIVPGHFFVGGNPWNAGINEKYYGLMDDMFVYDRALNGSDIVKLYQS